MATKKGVKKEVWRGVCTAAGGMGPRALGRVLLEAVGTEAKMDGLYEMAGSGWEVLLLIFWTAKMFLKLSSNLASSWSPSLTNLWFWKSKDKNSKSHGQWAEAPKVSDNLGLRFRLPPKVKWDFIQGRIAYVPWSFDHFPLSRRQRSKNSTILQPNSSSEIDRST